MGIAATLAGLVELAGSVELAGLAVPVESEGLVALAVPVESEGLVGPVESAALVAGIDRPRCRRVVEDRATGNTIRNIVAVPRIATAPLPTDLAVRRAATRSRIARVRPDNKSGDRVAIWLATEMERE